MTSATEMAGEPEPEPDTAAGSGAVPRLAVVSNSPDHDTGEPARQFAHTDLGNSEALVEAHGPDLIHVAEGWYDWDGRRFRRDDGGRLVMQRIKATVRDFYPRAARLDNDEERKRLAQHATRSESERALRAAVALAASDPRVIVEPDQLNSDPLRLTLPNGELDLETAQLHEHDRCTFSTLLAGVPYVPDAKCSRWLEFLETTFDQDRELIEFIRRAIGYMLTGRTDEQVLFLLHGNGANGKSVLLAILRAMLGEYARNTPSSTLLERRNGSDAIPNDLARLPGVRLVTAAETGDGGRLDESRVKALTGADVVSARFMRGEWFDYTPQFKLALATNHLPAIRGADHAMWRRVRLIPFTVTIADRDQDRQLTAKLLDELPGILAWAVQGCLDWQRDGLAPPPAVIAATEHYREESDAVGQFIEDACELHPRATTDAASLYAAYGAWCERNGERFPLTQTAFGRRLTERGLAADRHGTQRLRRGIALIEAP